MGDGFVLRQKPVTALGQRNSRRRKHQGEDKGKGAPSFGKQTEKGKERGVYSW